MSEEMREVEKQGVCLYTLQNSKGKLYSERVYGIEVVYLFSSREQALRGAALLRADGWEIKRVPM